MADHIITRGASNFLGRGADESPLPDPFHGLPPYARIQLITMRPTWSERWKLCDPALSHNQKRDILLDILFERRHHYEHQLAERRQAVYRQAISSAYEAGKPIPLPPHTLHSTSLRQMTRLRRLQDEREQQIREAYFQRRQERETEPDDEDEPRRNRGRSR